MPLDRARFQQALTHRSVSKQNYERLEFLGDALVDLFVGEMLFELLPRADEGELSRARAALVKESSLAEIARELKLGELLNLGASELKTGGWHRESILADAFEAMVAALYLDFGFEVCRERVQSWMGARVAAFARLPSAKDAKTQLQELLQARRLDLPQYVLVASQGADHAKTFEVECRIEALDQRARGLGSSRRAAEQVAAAALIKELEKNT